jgi:hypothetical protein
MLKISKNASLGPGKYVVHELAVLQELEVANDFVFQGAARLPEFILKITHPDTEHATKIYFHLHTMST